jgi:hypothetical protein
MVVFPRLSGVCAARTVAQDVQRFFCKSRFD